eukprot:gene41390-50506_t
MSVISKDTERAVSVMQTQFEAAVEQSLQKMLSNYRTLLKKYSNLADQEGIGRHEPMQIDVACENILHHGEQLLRMIHELRIRTLLRPDEVSQSVDSQGDTMNED